MTDEEKQERIKYVNDFMYENGFCNVYNNEDVPKIYIADLLDSMREKTEIETHNKVIDEVLKYFNNLIDNGIWNTSPFIIKEYLEKLRIKV